MAIDSQPAEPFPARNGALVLAPGGRVDAFIDATAPPGSTSDPAPRRQGSPPDRQARRLQRPPIRPAPLPPAPPLPSNGLPARLDLKNAQRVDLTLGGRRPTGSRRPDFTRHRPAGLPRQSRPHRGARPDQPRRDRHRVPSPRPSFPPAGPARRRLEAVLAGYAGDRTRPDPAHRLRWPNMPGAG